MEVLSPKWRCEKTTKFTEESKLTARPTEAWIHASGWQDLPQKLHASVRASPESVLGDGIETGLMVLHCV